MENINQTLNDAEQKIAHSSKTSPTAAGQANTQSQRLSDEERDALIDAINQIFSVFRVNYHNQFYAAYNDSDTLNQTTFFWLG